MPWIVAMTKPNHEQIAAENLRRQAYDYYLPRFLQAPKSPTQTPTVRPLFPRYIFVSIETAWYTLLGTRGISKVLMGETQPQPIPDQIIDGLRRREDKKGLVSLTLPPKFMPGARVRATGGPFTDRFLLYEGAAPHERVRCLMELLGRHVPVEVDESLLVAA